MKIVSSYGATLATLWQDNTGGRSIGQQATPADSAMAADLVGQGWTVGDLAEVLFCTSLQPSDAPDPRTVLAAVTRSLRCGRSVCECAAEVAARYGDDPDTASRRMRWSRAAVIAAFFVARPTVGLAS